MELLQVKNLTFSYPDRPESAILDVNFGLKAGELTLLCGESGCGKSTLLRLLKRELAPHGEMKGEIFFAGEPLSGLTPRQSAAAIGFVSQNPDQQIVTDQVWHELAFGLESLGVETSVIRRRVGEMASYFGIQGWYHQSTDALSGGQKQILNLASVMVMQPKLLLLDEPTSQLDPIAAANFMATLQKLNREFGLSILLAEHRLEEIYPVADQVLVLEQGRLLCSGTPEQTARQLRGLPMEASLPSAARIWSGLDVACPCPLTVREGRDFLQAHFSHLQGKSLPVPDFSPSEPVVEVKGLWFRYEKDAPDILRDLSLTVYQGEIFSILGGNGAGKSTTLNLIAGLERAYAGSLKLFGKKIKAYKGNSLYRGGLTLLPQNPETVFIKKTVQEDWADLLAASGCPKEEIPAKISAAADTFGVAHLLPRHPYDLSGGEQQKCALLKLLFTEPRLLLLDEPTKGLDALSKARFANLLRNLQKNGMTILMVTHDVEFAAEISDRCALFFDGEIVSIGPPQQFFSDHHFYTTAASRISRDVFANAVLCRQVVELCKEG